MRNPGYPQHPRPGLFAHVLGVLTIAVAEPRFSAICAINIAMARFRGISPLWVELLQRSSFIERAMDLQRACSARQISFRGGQADQSLKRQNADRRPLTQCRRVRGGRRAAGARRFRWSAAAAAAAA
jgi:hypothetical protein